LNSSDPLSNPGESQAPQNEPVQPPVKQPGKGTGRGKTGAERKPSVPPRQEGEPEKVKERKDMTKVDAMVTANAMAASRMVVGGVMHLGDGYTYTGYDSRQEHAMTRMDQILKKYKGIPNTWERCENPKGIDDKHLYIRMPTSVFNQFYKYKKSQGFDQFTERARVSDVQSKAAREAYNVHEDTQFQVLPRQSVPFADAQKPYDDALKD
jgi:hypothetical protein